MKLIDIVMATEGLNALSELKLPAKESFKMAQLLREVSGYIDDYHDTRTKLLQKYGHSHDGNKYDMLPEDRDAFCREMDDLDGMEIGIHSEKVCIPADTMISPKEIYRLEPFIEIGE